MRGLCPAASNAALYPKNTAVFWSGRSLTWDSLNNYVFSTSRYLKEVGMCADNRVLVVMDASPAHLICLLALWRIGALVCLAGALPAARILAAAFKPDFVIGSRVDRNLGLKNARWSDIEKVVSYSYNDSFLGKDAALIPQWDLTCPAFARMKDEGLVVQTHAQLKADPGILQAFFLAAETGGCVVL